MYFCHPPFDFGDKMDRYIIVENFGMMGMGINVRMVVSKSTQIVMAYFNENSQIIFPKPLNCNIVAEVLEYVIEVSESKDITKDMVTSDGNKLQNNNKNRKKSKH